MKLRILGIIIIIGFISFMCKKEIEEEIPEYTNCPTCITVGTTYSSGCLGHKTKLTESFEYIYENNEIKVYHNNAHYNCAAELVFKIESISGNLIVLSEVDTSNTSANCVCYFNISTTIMNIAGGTKYTIEIWNEGMTTLLDSCIIETE